MFGSVGDVRVKMGFSKKKENLVTAADSIFFIEKV